MPKVARSTFVCQSCGRVESRWLGRCPDCNAWSSFAEEAAPRPVARGAATGEAPIRLRDVQPESAPRLRTGIGELDRVLGGGLVPGSLVLLGGDPGIGKSTLLLQALDRLAAAQPGPVLYVSGEESARQIALRAERLGAGADRLLVLAETSLDKILAHAETVKPSVLAVDSVQTVACEELQSIPGSVGQVREAASR